MIIYGKNVVREAVFSKRPIDQLWIDRKFNDHRFIQFLEDRNQRYIKVDKNVLNQMTKDQLHQGIVADVKPYETFELEDVLVKDKNQRFLLLDSIEDPHNLGAIMRTAEATGLDGIIVSKKGQVPLNATVAKVSSGAIEHVKVISVGNINQTILRLQKEGFLVVGTDGATDRTYDTIPLHQPLCVVLGNEGEGIRPLVKKNCDLLVKIPMIGKINSLNVSVAAALMMYQIMNR